MVKFKENSENYSFLTKKIKYLPPEHNLLKYTALGAVLGLLFGLLSTAVFPDLLINLFGFIGICSINQFTLQTCAPIPFTVATFLGMFAGASFGLIIDILRKLFKRG